MSSSDRESVVDSELVAGPSGMGKSAKEKSVSLNFYGTREEAGPSRWIAGDFSDSSDEENASTTYGDDDEENVDQPSALEAGGDNESDGGEEGTAVGDSVGDAGDAGERQDPGGDRQDPGDDGAGRVGKRGRKSVRDPSQWARNIAKAKRNRGEEYISEKTKRTVRKRELGPRCDDGCFDKCTMDVVKRVFDSFWKIGDYDLENAYLLSRVQPVPIKRKRTAREVSQRKCNYAYTIKDGENLYNVCRKGFKSIHGISEKKLAYVLGKKSSTNGTPIADQRGRRPPWNKMDEDSRNRVHDHIKSIPVTVSHYTRAKAPHRRYMEESTTIKELYQKYKKWMIDNYCKERTVGESFYSHVFTHDFNIVTKPPMKDTCTTCDMAKAKIRLEQELRKDTTAIEAEWQTHKDKAKAAQDYLKKMQEDTDDDRCVIAIDLQQTLPCPRIPTGQAYYLRKLWCYNFCIYDVKKKQSFMYFWPETVAGRGSDEIASCILHWLDQKRSAGSNAEADFTTLTIFADNCAGQNKNLNIILMALREVHSGRLFRVEMTFLVSGHSFLPCDRSFGVVENKIRHRQLIYTPSEYCSVIDGPKFKLYEAKREDFKDIKCLTDKVTVRRATQRRFSKASQIITTHSYKEGYILKNDFSDHSTDADAFHVRLQPGQKSYKKQLFDLSAHPLPLKYTSDRRLQPAKVKDLETMTKFMDTAVNKEWWQQLVHRQRKLPAQQQSRDEEGEAESDDDMQDYYYDPADDQAVATYGAASQ